MVMDPANRRAMDGLLKTWKQPVPESMDTNPVFSPEVTRDIENALIKIRTVTVQQQAMAQRTPHGLPPRPVSNPVAGVSWRNTPTPPQGGPRHAAPNDPRVRHVSLHFHPTTQASLTDTYRTFRHPTIMDSSQCLHLLLKFQHHNRHFHQMISKR